MGLFDWMKKSNTPVAPVSPQPTVPMPIAPVPVAPAAAPMSLPELDAPLPELPPLDLDIESPQPPVLEEQTSPANDELPALPLIDDLPELPDHLADDSPVSAQSNEQEELPPSYSPPITSRSPKFVSVQTYADCYSAVIAMRDDATQVLEYSGSIKHIHENMHQRLETLRVTLADVSKRFTQMEKTLFS
jgi:hypothetical protein